MRSAFSIVTALLLSVFLASPTAAQDSASLAEAQRLLKQGRHTEALARTDDFLARNPKDAQGRFLKGLILAEQDRTEEAVGVFVHLTRDYPELPEPYNNLAVLYAQQRDYERARSALEMAIRTHPAYAIAYENLGDVYAKLASQAYDKALQIDSANPAAQGKLSLIRELFDRTGSPVPQAAAGQLTSATKASPAVQPAAAKPAVSIARDTSTPAPRQPPTAAGRTPGNENRDASDADRLRAVTRALESWAQAWSRKDVDAYLAHYEPEFQPDAQTSHAEWAAVRRARVSKPGDIDVEIGAVSVKLDGEGRAVARFYQRYRSDSFNAENYKTLVLRRIGERWLIVEERIG